MQFTLIGITCVQSRIDARVSRFGQLPGEQIGHRETVQMDLRHELAWADYVSYLKHIRHCESSPKRISVSAAQRLISDRVLRVEGTLLGVANKVFGQRRIADD